MNTVSQRRVIWKMQMHFFFALDSNKLAAPEAAPIPKYLSVLFVID